MYQKHRPPEKLRSPGCIETTDPPKISDPLGVSKTQTPQKSQIPRVYRKYRPPINSDPLCVSKKHRPPGCIENSDPPGVSKTPTPEKFGALDVSKTQTPWVSRKHRTPKNSDPLESQTPGCLEKFRL